MDPPEQLRSPMFIVGSLPASGLNVLVVGADRQFPVALFFVGGSLEDSLAAPCNTSLTFSFRAEDVCL